MGHATSKNIVYVYWQRKTIKLKDRVRQSHGAQMIE